MRPPGSANGGRSCRESWKTSGRRSLAGLKVRKPFPSTAALLPIGCVSYTHYTNAPTAFLVLSSSDGLSPTTPVPPSQTDDSSHEPQEPESFAAWSDRLAQEHAQKRQQQQQHGAEEACQPPRAEGSSHSWRQQEKEQRLFQERARAKEEELRESRARREQEAPRDPGLEPARAGPRAEHPRGAARGSLWRFVDVPWPCPGGGDPEAMAAALVARGPPLEEQGALRRYLRVQQVRWHPDRFLQRFRSQIETCELGRVMGAVTALSQALNRHAEALK